jgi:hypothetical protein
MMIYPLTPRRRPRRNRKTLGFRPAEFGMDDSDHNDKVHDDINISA